MTMINSSLRWDGCDPEVQLLMDKLKTLSNNTYAWQHHHHHQNRKFPDTGFRFCSLLRRNKNQKDIFHKYLTRLRGDGKIHWWWIFSFLHHWCKKLTMMMMIENSQRWLVEERLRLSRVWKWWSHFDKTKTFFNYFRNTNFTYHCFKKYFFQFLQSSNFNFMTTQLLLLNCVFLQRSFLAFFLFVKQQISRSQSIDLIHSTIWKISILLPLKKDFRFRFLIVVKYIICSINNWIKVAVVMNFESELIIISSSMIITSWSLFLEFFDDDDE